MGRHYARNGLGIARPRVGLLNVGTEEHKGRAELKLAQELIQPVAAARPASTIVGFVEGRDLPSSRVDVIVTDGFTGNVALKTGEGTATPDARTSCARRSRATPLSRIAALLALTSLKPAAEADRPAPGERRRVPGPERHRGEKSTAPPMPPGSRRRSTWRSGWPSPASTSGWRRGLHRTCRRARMPAGYAGGRGRSRTMTIRAVVRGVGHYLPARVVPNAEFEKTLDTSDEWIVTRTGIQRRHFAAEGETTSTMGATAPRRRRWTDAGLTAGRHRRHHPGHLDPRPDLPVLRHHGAGRASAWTQGFAFDVQAVCAGFVFALANANALILTGQAKRVLVIGAETFSRILDWTDRATCVLFGDGAGALVLEAAEGAGTNADRGILACDLNTDGRYRDMLYVDGGVSTTGTAGKLRMQGNPLFRQAVEKLAETADAALAKAGLGPRRRRLDRAASGQPADHRRHRAEAACADGAGGGDGAGPRQHLGRIDSPGAVGRRAPAAG